MAKEKKAARGKPFVKGDQRINRDGVSKEKVEVKELVRGIARAVCEREVIPGSPVIKQIFEEAAEQARAGSLPHAEFLLDWAYGKPPQDASEEVSSGRRIVIDLGSAVTRRASDITIN